jgi:hypothetical protein
VVWSFGKGALDPTRERECSGLLNNMPRNGDRKIIGEGTQWYSRRQMESSLPSESYPVKRTGSGVFFD